MQGQVTAENVPAPPRGGKSSGDRTLPRIAETRPQALHQPLPAYPPQAMDAQVSCEIRLMYHVETDGSAAAVRFNWVLRPPDTYLKAFEAAILEAISEWKFKPAIRHLTRQMPDGSVDTETQAVTRSKWIIIRFQVVDGQGVTE